ncbi:MAG: UDP-N-acetylglucosamine 1-carboxyvinyltransferase [Chloroflexi bacterium]|nr:UDP-N-acetylglucosamine 1-carboxyvinyltransferase [Chloroflexota bacterium]MDL1882062.1 UDP-N-acetylglucosamine 1-carboxyvinyltransferase [Anaerolineae bacterium CFX8]
MRIRVEGKTPLNGIYRPSGNPNAAMALLTAALLTPEAVTLRNVPDTINTRTMLLLAERLGVKIARLDAHTIRIQAEQINRRAMTPADTGGLVSGLLYLAPMLRLRQQVRVEIDFPLNRIRTHLEALRDLGQEVITTSGAVEVRAAPWEKKEIILTQASVTATAVVLMLAACLGKETIIHNAACEPHVQELANLLCEMGAHIEGIGSNVMRVLSPPSLNGADVTIGPDHIEAASAAAIGAMCGGRVQIAGIRRADMRMIAKTYWQLGIHLDMDEDVIFVPKHEGLSLSPREEDADLSVETSPWPAFPSDLVAMATVIATQSRGTSLVHEKLFNNRLLFVDKLKAMGAQIVLCDPHRAIVMGPSPLYGIYMDSPDVRAGLGMLAAALVAQGESVIDNAEVIERTFAGVFGKLQALGARITAV